MIRWINEHSGLGQRQQFRAVPAARPRVVIDIPIGSDCERILVNDREVARTRDGRMATELYTIYSKYSQVNLYWMC